MKILPFVVLGVLSVAATTRAADFDTFAGRRWRR